jgi:precorrin-4 methylase
MNAKILIVLENTDVSNINSVEELILARSQLQVIDAGFQDLKLDTPEWVVDRLSEIDQEINIRTRNELLKRLRAAKARRSALLSKDERRQNLEAEIADLEGKLA